MELNKENDILETTLSIAENGYAEAYRFLLDAYEQAPEAYGPQPLYFLACLVGGAGMAADGDRGSRLVVPPGGACG